MIVFFASSFSILHQILSSFPILLCFFFISLLLTKYSWSCFENLIWTGHNLTRKLKLYLFYLYFFTSLLLPVLVETMLTIYEISGQCASCLIQMFLFNLEFRRNFSSCCGPEVNPILLKWVAEPFVRNYTFIANVACYNCVTYM